VLHSMLSAARVTRAERAPRARGRVRGVVSPGVAGNHQGVERTRHRGHVEALHLVQHLAYTDHTVQHDDHAYQHLQTSHFSRELVVKRHAPLVRINLQ